MAGMLILGISLVTCPLHRTMKYTRKLRRRHHRHHRRRQWSRRQLRQITTTSWSARRHSSRISTVILPKTTCSRMTSTLQILRPMQRGRSRRSEAIRSVLRAVLSRMLPTRENSMAISFAYRITRLQILHLKEQVCLVNLTMHKSIISASRVRQLRGIQAGGRHVLEELRDIVMETRRFSMYTSRIRQ